MRILVINPNSSKHMTEHIRAEILRIKRDDTEVTVVANTGAPPAIESARDVAQAVPPLLEQVTRANEEGYDAIILACFSDPGLQAAREISDILVLGIEETTLHVAAMLGHKFTILTPLAKRIPAKEREVRGYGLESALASVRSLDLSVSETDADPEATKARILELARQARDEDGAEVIVLGCAGMVGYAKDVEQELGLVVLDPTSVAFKIAEGLIESGVRHSKQGPYFAVSIRQQ
ncbi:aspartate/glutamate racemase family protein [Candidatus Acetothermia bacterium]|nr:MAG: aspartate/glutamate racemase family protein [Candidatus Acetothermia bacterium]